MSFFGIPRGRRKAYSTIRITIDNDNVSNNATMYVDSAAGVLVTYRTTAWLELVASFPVDVNFFEVFDSTGFTSRFGTGGIGLEADLMLDLPGGNGFNPVKIDAGTRLSSRPLTNPPVGAEMTLNFWD